ncbi:hypothetical protein [Treponema primitia]|uniref:hypothetical protein n=1 Tax=Treponema primitia TaxID=88058 RepID=UPI0002555325|nr:hypothetical protein [Treponema primitia]
MGRQLNFSLRGASFCAEPLKLDRAKLYGKSATLAIDEKGGPCTLVSMDSGGAFIIPQGGIGLGILSPESRWVERSSLKAVTLGGHEAVLMKSSYDGVILLEKSVPVDEFLNHSITAVYNVETDTAFIDAIGENIYTFTYNYRDGYEGTAAFLLKKEEKLFMLLGYPAHFEMLSLSEAGEIDEDALEDDENENDGEIDFSMF